jgi:5-methylcytosine-specific restriction endonuclease McrA
MKKPWWAKKDEKKWEQLVFNYEFLKEVEEEKGSLHCEYCGKRPLRVYRWDEKIGKDVATADHFLPKSQYPELAKDKTNLVVSCSSCNSNKGDKIIKETEIKFRR